MIREDSPNTQNKVRRITVFVTLAFLGLVFSIYLVIAFWGRITLSGYGDNAGFIAPNPIPTPTNLTSPSIAAVWVAATDPALQSEENLQNMMNAAKKLGINTVFVQVSWRYATNFPSEKLFQAKYIGRDVLQEAVDMGKALGIEVHAWYTVLLGGSSDSPNPLWQQHGLAAANNADKWLVQSIDGKWSDFLDPTIPEVRQLAISTAVELATHGKPGYRPAGVHLDFLRFPEDDNQVPGSEWGYSPRMIEQYMRETNNAYPETNDRDFMKWKCDQTGSLLEDIYAAVKKAEPTSVVSAATITWGDGPRTFKGFEHASASTDVAQCWNRWAESGKIDMIVPMVYFDDAQHEVYHQHWIEYMARVRAQYPDIKIVAGQATWLNSAKETMTQLSRGSHTLDGYSLYSWRDIANNPDLKLQLKHAIWRR